MDGRLEHGDARALGAAKSGCDVEAVLGEQAVEVVAGDAPGDVGITLADEVCVVVAEIAEPLRQLVRTRALDRVLARGDTQAVAPVGEDVELGDVVRGQRAAAEELRHHRVDAAGVVPDHPAEGAACVRRGVRAVREAVAVLGLVPEMVEDEAGLDAGELALGVDLDDLVQVLAEVDEDGHVAALAGQAGSAAAREDRSAVLAAGGHRRDDIVDRARDDDADGHVAVVGAVGRVHRAGSGVETDFSGEGRAELALERACIEFLGGSGRRR